MSATHDKFVFVIGDTWVIDAVCNDGDGSPINLSLVSGISWTMYDGLGNTALQASLGSNITVVDQAAGTIEILIPASATGSVAAATYEDVLRVTMNDGTVSTQATGLILVSSPRQLSAIPPTLVTPTTGFTMAGLIALEGAIASGARSVSYDGKTVSYGSLDEMLRIRAMMRRALALDPATSATVLAAHDRGFDGSIDR